MITVAADKNYSTGNLAVVLQGHSSPVILSTVSTPTKELDAKVDIQVPILGPNAVTNTIPAREATGRDLLNALYGILPPGAKPMDVSGANAKAWVTANGGIILTGALQVISPAPLERTGVGDGYYAYRLDRTRVVLATQGGAERKVVLRERR